MKELAEFLRKKLQDQCGNPLWIENEWGGGDTFVGFYSTYEIDYEALAKEIELFERSFKK